ncbi:hypothetical protein GOODEAATRI_033526, partial [Goodea atripinnis]
EHPTVNVKSEGFGRGGQEIPPGQAGAQCTPFDISSTGKCICFSGDKRFPLEIMTKIKTFNFRS